MIYKAFLNFLNKIFASSYKVLDKVLVHAFLSLLMIHSMTLLLFISIISINKNHQIQETLCDLIGLFENAFRIYFAFTKNARNIVLFFTILSYKLIFLINSIFNLYRIIAIYIKSIITTLIYFTLIVYY